MKHISEEDGTVRTIEIFSDDISRHVKYEFSDFGFHPHDKKEVILDMAFLREMRRQQEKATKEKEKYFNAMWAFGVTVLQKVGSIVGGAVAGYIIAKGKFL
ncbi:MAG: hypothetical protein MK052_01235 [Alphaproteobacteria bacterium]|nr:hypothetical protein [Alphaproteobacteria bacterium]